MLPMRLPLLLLSLKPNRTGHMFPESGASDLPSETMLILNSPRNTGRQWRDRLNPRRRREMNIAKLHAHFEGEILTPASAGYDAARRIWNGMIDRRPAAIARCSGPSDVAAAVRFSADEGLYPAVRGGGHNVAGLAMLDGGIVIDVSQMKDIAVNASARTAAAQTGATWGEFDRATRRTASLPRAASSPQRASPV